MDEQKNISKFLEIETSIINQLNKKIEESILLLKEYRSSLITHAVSGQIDISKYEVSK
jgi:type I restriction enzyme S subunit